MPQVPGPRECWNPAHMCPPPPLDPWKHPCHCGPLVVLLSPLGHATPEPWMRPHCPLVTQSADLVFGLGSFPLSIGDQMDTVCPTSQCVHRNLIKTSIPSDPSFNVPIPVGDFLRNRLILQSVNLSGVREAGGPEYPGYGGDLVRIC